MDELKKVRDNLRASIKNCENPDKTIKDGNSYRWHSIFRDLNIIENAIEILKIYE